MVINLVWRLSQIFGCHFLMLICLYIYFAVDITCFENPWSFIVIEFYYTKTGQFAHRFGHWCNLPASGPYPSKLCLLMCLAKCFVIKAIVNYSISSFNGTFQMSTKNALALRSFKKPHLKNRPHCFFIWFCQISLEKIKVDLIKHERHRKLLMLESWVEHKMLA